jgi:hypothetical protein
MIEQIVLVSVVGTLVIYSLYDSINCKYNKNNILMNEIDKKKMSELVHKRRLSREIL